MKIRIIVAYVPRYKRGHGLQFVPPITGMHLAAITPPEHEVELFHEQARRIPVTAVPDLVAISFFSGFAREAYRLADAYRRVGVQVVCGGPHVTYWVDEALEHFDAVVTGEAEEAWPALLRDANAGRLQRVYRGTPSNLVSLPTPRYDLLERNFIVRHVIQATRGCPFHCGFCSVPDLNPGFRVRPIGDVMRDIEAPRRSRLFWDQVVWFWDDNLLVQRRWAKDLLREMCNVRHHWLTQASIDIVKDDELLGLMERSGCIGIFLGIESFDAAALATVGKAQNRIAQYREAVRRLHDRGICVMAGFISGFDTQTAAEIVNVADQLNELEFDVPFLSVLTPFRGTPLYDTLLSQGRILADRDWPFYNGYNVAFQPARMTPTDLHQAHRTLFRRAFSPRLVADRLVRGVRQLKAPAAMLSAAMNGFYGLKSITGNLPADAQVGAERIAHPPFESEDSTRSAASL